MKRRECDHQNQQGITAVACSDGGWARYRVRDYFVGVAREKHGSDLKLCGEHARQWQAFHPFGPSVQSYKH